MDLDFDKYCLVETSPTTVLPAPRCHSKAANGKSSGKPKYVNDIPSLNEDFEISFGHYRSASCKADRSKSVSQEDNEVLKRGSVYQSSEEARLLQVTESVAGRKKIEFSRGTASAFSFGIINSLCSLDEDSSLVEQNRDSVMSLSEQSTSSVYGNEVGLCSHDSMITCESIAAPTKEANNTGEKDLAVNSHKSLSARLALPHSAAKSECNGSRASSPNAGFSPAKKMLDPFVKSKSHRSPLSSLNETGCKTISGLAGFNRNKTVCRSLLSDISGKPRHVEYNHQFEGRENHNSGAQCSPAHLHGLLKLDNKRGLPFYQFSVKSPEDVYVAKTWKVENDSTWVYTFHSPPHGRKRNTSGWGFKESNRESSMVGRMHVSCHLCMEFKGAGELNDSMVTEFVLYDTIHSRKSTASEDNSIFPDDVIKEHLVSDEISSSGSCELKEISAKTKTKCQLKHSRDTGQFESSASQPLTSAKLHPDLEIAAIVMQVPLKKRESLKFKSGDKKLDESAPNLLDLCQIENAKESISDTSSPGKMYVVIPAGNHSLPVTESCGPSPLLDRWRLGGGCDCGGWDMACPLSIFSNPRFKVEDRQPLIDNQTPTELFLQGRKDNIPAFTMRMIEDGKYAVDFHAQLSSLQAFSICVAILHAAEASTIVGQERSKQMLQSDSLRVFAEEEIKIMLDAIADEEKSKVNKMEGVLPTFVLNPPFSPIARV